MTKTGQGQRRGSMRMNGNIAEKMTKIADDLVAKARQLDLLSYLQMQAPWELVPIGPNRYQTKAHDSLKIDHGKWYWWSRGIGGRSALDYLVAVEGWEFRKAVLYILELERIPLIRPAPTQSAKEKVLLRLPAKASSNRRVQAYLMRRGIDSDIIDYFVSKGLIYESHPYHNTVFVGLSEKGEPAYAALRSTGQKRFAGEAAGSQKAYAFSFSGGRPTTVHVFESAIDLLSYATLQKLRGADWKTESYVSLGGCAFSIGEGLPPSLRRMLHEKPNIRTIKLHMDNDRAGRSYAQAIIAQFADDEVDTDYQVLDRPPPCGKDVNDYLIMKLKQAQEKQNLKQNEQEAR